jgi:hypothetical protein
MDNIITGVKNEKPPNTLHTRNLPFYKEKSFSRDKSLDRNNRVARDLLFWNIPRRGQLLNRGVSLLNIYVSMDNQ